MDSVDQHPRGRVTLDAIFDDPNFHSVCTSYGGWMIEATNV